MRSTGTACSKSHTFVQSNSNRNASFLTMRLWNDCWNKELSYENALKVTTSLKGGRNRIFRSAGVLVWVLHVTNSTTALRGIPLHKGGTERETERDRERYTQLLHGVGTSH